MLVEATVLRRPRKGGADGGREGLREEGREGGIKGGRKERREIGKEGEK